MAFEAVVLRHPEIFSAEAVDDRWTALRIEDTKINLQFGRITGMEKEIQGRQLVTAQSQGFH